MGSDPTRVICLWIFILQSHEVRRHFRNKTVKLQCILNCGRKISGRVNILSLRSCGLFSWCQCSQVTIERDTFICLRFFSIFSLAPSWLVVSSTLECVMSVILPSLCCLTTFFMLTALCVLVLYLGMYCVLYVKRHDTSLVYLYSNS